MNDPDHACAFGPNFGWVCECGKKYQDLVEMMIRQAERRGEQAAFEMAAKAAGPGDMLGEGQYFKGRQNAAEAVRHLAKERAER